MADFDLSLAITGDGSGGAAAANQVDGSLKSLEGTTKDVSATARDLEKATGAVATAQGKVTAGSKSLASAQTTLMGGMNGAARAAEAQAAANGRVGVGAEVAAGAISKQSLAAGALALAERRLETAMRQLTDAQAKEAAGSDLNAAAKKRLADAVSNAQTRVASASLVVERQLSRQTNAQNDNEKASIRQQYAVRNVGQQFGDFGLQVAAGISPARAFGQQAGQLGYALSEMGGKLGAVGAFLTGPWGIALTVAAAVAAPFVEKLFQSGAAADSAVPAYKNLADATKALDEATGRSNKTKEQEINLSFAATRQKLKEALATRELLKATLAGLQGSIDNPNAIDAETGSMGVGTSLAANRIKAQQAANDADIAAAKSSLEYANRQEAFEGIQNRVAAATDKVAAAQQRYNAVEKIVRAGVLAGTIAEEDANRVLLVAQQRLDAVKDSGKNAAAARREHTATVREAAAAARDAAKTEAEYGAILDGMVAKYQPAIAQAEKYATALRDIADLQKRGDIGLGQSVTFSLGAMEEDKAARAKMAKDAADRFFPNAAGDFADIMEETGRKFGAQLNQDAQTAGDSFSQAASKVGSILGGTIGGKAGSLLTRATGSGGGLDVLGNLFQKNDPYGGYTPGQLREMDTLPAGVGQRGNAVNKSQQDLSDSLTKLSKGVGISDAGAKKIGEFGGKAIQGAATGAFTNSIFAPLAKGLGLKTSKTGAEIGGAIGSFLPIPGGEIIGSLVGSITGGLFKSTKKGSATITGANGEATVSGTSGNSASRIAAATGSANSVIGQLNQITQTLGGTLGNFAVSIGMRDKKYVVDASGSGKTKGAGTTKYATEEEAQAAALANAIADGAVTGLSAAVAAALRSSPDVTAAVNEALKVQDVEAAIGGIGYNLNKTFKDFDTQAKQRVAIAQKYGLDVVTLEKNTAAQRQALITQSLKSTVGDLQDFLESLNSGDLFEGSATDKRGAILGRIDDTRAQALAGVEGAASTLASLYNSLLALDKESFGTGGVQFAADRTKAASDAADVIRAEAARISAAADQGKATLDAANQNNSLTSESNNILAQIRAGITGLPGQLAGAIGSQISGGYLTSSVIASVARQPNLVAK